MRCRNAIAAPVITSYWVLFYQTVTAIDKRMLRSVLGSISDDVLFLLGCTIEGCRTDVFRS